MDPFLGEVRVFFSFFAPRGWAFCHGQMLSIAQNPALFSLLGTLYGGDGRTTFALPDLRGRVPSHVENTDWSNFGEQTGMPYQSFDSYSPTALRDIEPETSNKKKKQKSAAKT